MTGRGTAKHAYERHIQIARMHKEGYLLKEIALAIGVKSHVAVLHHLQGKCDCIRDWYKRPNDASTE